MQTTYNQRWWAAEPGIWLGGPALGSLATATAATHSPLVEIESTLAGCFLPSIEDPEIYSSCGSLGDSFVHFFCNHGFIGLLF